MRIIKFSFMVSFILIIMIFFWIIKMCKYEPKYNSNININLKISKNNIIKKIDLDEYIVGVVAAEMPASFEMEALKAQSVAARTYVFNKIIYNKERDYITDDYKCDQAYISYEVMKKRWGKNYIKNLKKIYNAVISTSGEIITYKGKPINAVYHALSIGKTQNSEDVWGCKVPYLKSVISNLDKKSPKYLSVFSISKNEFKNKINIDNDNDKIKIDKIKKLKSGYIESININNKFYKGTDIRKIFNLKSNAFDIKIGSKEVTFTTKGFGHGVGMSQYGATYMANEGKTYSEILKHYYKGCKIKKLINIE